MTAKNLWNAVKSSHKYPLGKVSAGKTAHQRTRLSIAHKREVFSGHEPQNHISLPIDFLFYIKWQLTQRSSATPQKYRKSTLIWWFNAECGGLEGFREEEDEDTWWNEVNRWQKLKKRGERHKGNRVMYCDIFAKMNFFWKVWELWWNEKSPKDRLNLMSSFLIHPFPLPSWFHTSFFFLWKKTPEKRKCHI